MKWHLYKKDDPNTWPKIDCPMMVYFDQEGILSLDYVWDNEENYFADDYGEMDHDECYYSYIAYVPNGYKTHKVIKCTDDGNCKIGCADGGYCMYDFYNCEQQKRVNEYEIEEKRIWKEWEE